MKREMIEKVVRVAVERNFISLNGFNIPEEERLEEIVTIIQNNIEEEKSKAIETLRHDFSDFLMNAKNVTTTDDVTGEQRSLTSDEVVDIIQCEYFGIQELIDEILSE